MKMDTFSGILPLAVFGVVVAVLWAMGAFQGFPRASGGPDALAAASDRASAAYAECLEGRIWRDFHVCVPAALELLEAARAQSMAGPVSRDRRVEAVVRVQSASEYLGRILALCDLTGHEEACVAVEPVIELYGAAPSAGESAPRTPASNNPTPRPGISLPRS